MINIHKRKRFLSAIITISLLLSCLTCYNLSATANNNDKVDEYKDKISEYEEKIKDTESKLEELKGDISKVQEYIEELDKQVAMYQAQIDACNSQIEVYQQQIDSYEEEKRLLELQIDELNTQINNKNEEIKTKEKEIEDKYEELKELIRSNFINGQSSTLEILLCSDDFSDYLTKIQFVSSLADYEKNLIKDINTDIEEINKAIEQIEADKAQIDVLREEISEKIAEIQTLQTAVEDNKAKVVENQNIILQKVEENSNYLQSLNNQSNEYNEMIESYQEEIDKFDREIEALLQASGSTGNGSLVNSSGLICPLQYSGVYVSSPFYRNSDGSYHGALDLCVYGGTYGLNISAAESGTVITAAYHWSYGNYVIIDHGNGLSTLYAHASSLAVGTGQSVSKGQTIAYVGSTGNSGGPHLHFEVRINGSRVDPSAYINV